MRHEIVCDLFYGNMLAAPGRLPQPADCKIVQDREHPGAGIIISAPVPMRDHAFKAVLHEIVSSDRVVNETTGIAS
ncbi:Oligopeptide-binding protein oppA [Mesorhizobium loti]|nr:Oligopeptide-binding protein oppA [Mesorhizobium loti]